MFFAYFGPETFLPLTSVIAGVVGVVLMFGKNTFRLLLIPFKKLANKSGQSAPGAHATPPAPHFDAGTGALAKRRAKAAARVDHDQQQETARLSSARSWCWVWTGSTPRWSSRCSPSGELPNLAALRERGGLSRVATTTPAQTPVAWSTFATGVEPRRTRHLRLPEARPRPPTCPTWRLTATSRRTPSPPPRPSTCDRASPSGPAWPTPAFPSIVLRCPCTYPPDRLAGPAPRRHGRARPPRRPGHRHLLHDENRGLKPGESEQVVTLEPDATGRFETYLIGPRAPRDREGVRLPMSLDVRLGQQSPDLRIAGASIQPGSTWRPGSWSDWVQVNFKLGMLQTVAGMVRFRVMRLEPEVELYASPINFDPQRASVPDQPSRRLRA